MSNIQVLAGAGVGHVRAVFSGRCRGFAAPLDLVRVHLRAVVRSGVRRRLAVDFGGYLVTEEGPAVVPMFSRHRVWHEQGPDLYCMTSERMGWGYRSEGVASGPIDAPALIPAGSMWSGDSGFDGTGSCIPRDRWHLRQQAAEPEAAEPEAAALPVWRDGAGRVVCLTVSYERVRGLREGFEDCQRDCMDAPHFLPAGSVLRRENAGEALASDRRFFRWGWYE